MSAGPSTDTRSPSLASYFVHDPSAAQFDRQWSRISEQLGQRRPGARWFVLVPAALALILVLVIGARWRRAAAPASWEGAMLEADATGQVLHLPDGAEIRLAQATSVRVATWTHARVVLALDHGAITVDVPHVEGRTWIVAAGAFDVRVVGTRFVVRRGSGSEGDAVEVEVERGHVEVTRRDAPDDARSLSAGESWRAGTPVTIAPTHAAAEPPPPAASTAPEPAPPSDGTSALPSEPAPAPPSWEDLAKARKYRPAYDALGKDGFGRAVDAAGPEKLFLLGETARGAGHLRDAERAFDTLRTRHRGDARAGLAAFELGRLRLDGLGKASGAAQAFGDAIALAPGAPFREDAEARRVQALEASGAAGACAQARDAYLARYPSGAHAAVVRSRCAGR